MKRQSCQCICALFNLVRHAFFVLYCAFTSKVQIVGRVDDNPHQGKVESSHLGSDLKFDTAKVQVMGAQQAVDSIDGLSLYFSPVKTFHIYS